MKKYTYTFEAVIACMAFVDMETKKKAITNFLKSFDIKPDIEKIKPDLKPNTYYHYVISAICEDSSQLRVFQFVQSLQNFASFHNIPIHEQNWWER